MDRLVFLTLLFSLSAAHRSPERLHFTRDDTGVLEADVLEVRSAPSTAGNCAANPCKNWGVCISAPGGHTCACKAGWGGNDCNKDAGNPIIQTSLFTNNGVTIWGTWQGRSQCQKGFFATAFQVKFTPRKGDDTAINKFRLYCSRPDGSETDRHYLEQGHDWEEWGSLISCPTNYYIVNFNQQVDPDSGGGSDDWGVAAYEFTCRGPGLLGTETTVIRSETGGAGWGNWGTTKSDTCDEGAAICAFKTRLVGYQGWAVWDDDVAIVDTNFYCCNFQKKATRYLLRDFKFEFDSAKLLNKTIPKVVDKSSLNNRDSKDAVIDVTLSSKISNEDSIHETAGVSATVSVEISVESEALQLAGSFGLSIKSSYSTKFGKTITETSTVSMTLTLKVPGGFLGEVEMVMLEAQTDVPYTAQLVTYYGDGTTDDRRIAGMWKSIRAIKFHVAVPENVVIINSS